jgi:hypothetical protein
MARASGVRLSVLASLVDEYADAEPGVFVSFA